MPRARNIKPAFFKNELLVELPIEARLLFIGLWTLADREGRLENRPKRIKMEIFPADNFDIEQLLSLLASSGFLEIYNDKAYIQILNFKKHQSPHIKEAASLIPAPDKHQTSTMLAALNPEPLSSESPLLNLETPTPKEEGVLEDFKGKRKYDVNLHLNDTGRAYAKLNAPDWDMYYLIRVYNEGIASGKRASPDNANAAFPAWCERYTKGKSP